MKIICVGRNYVAHAKELNNDVPSRPMLFMKPDSSVLHRERPFYYPDFSENIHYEAEIVLKICKNGRSIEKRFAHKYYNEMTIGLDLTARDLQAELKKKGHPWEIAKAFDNSAVLGQWIPFGDADPTNINFRLERNGENVQIGNTGNMIFPFDELISYISRFFKLQMGDIIFTGTPAGVGPIAIEDRFQGFIEDQSLLNLLIK